MSSDMTSPEATGAPAQLRLTLDRVRRALRWGLLAELFNLTLTVVAGTVLVGCAAAALGVEPKSLGIGLLATMAIGLVAVLSFIVWRWQRLLATPRAIAHWVDTVHGSAESGSLLAAFELARDRGQFGESPRLADAGVEAVVENIPTAQTSAVRAIWTRVRRSMVLPSVPVAGLAVLVLLAPGVVMTPWRAMTDLDQIEEVLAPVPPEPRLGDIRLTYRFPAYSRRPPRTVEAPSGFIRALPGTEVEITTSARRSIREAELLVTHGDGENPQRISVRADGRRLKATLVVSRAGRYRFRIVGADGVRREERRGHEIELEADDAPVVELLRPSESPLEVNERDRISLVFSARDDFELGEASVHWRVLGSTREGHVRLTSAPAGRRRYRGEAPFDLAGLEFRPGDRVAYTVEVRDNDTVNGPKVGASATQELRIYSKRDHHARVVALQQKVLDELVHVLGDNLDSAFENFDAPQRYEELLTAADGIVRRARALDPVMREAVEAIRRDPLGRNQVAQAFERARRELFTVTTRKRRSVRAAARVFKKGGRSDRNLGGRIRRRQASMVQSLEKNVVYLADLLNDQRLIDAEALTQELRAQQEALREAIQEYKDAPTDEKRAAIAEAIQEIRNRINEITRQLAQLRDSIPQDFVNRDALQPESTEADMEAVEQMLEDGDLDAALDALDNMLQRTERMLSQLQEGRETLQSREYSEIQQRAQQLYDDLQKLEQAQREIAERTEALSRQALERMKERLGDAQAFVDRQIARLELAKKTLQEARPKPEPFMPDLDLFERIERRLDDGMRAIEARDFGAAQDVLRRADGQMGRMQQETRRRTEQARRFGEYVGEQTERADRALNKARPPVEEVLRDIESLMPKPSEMLSGPEQKKLERLRQAQQRLEKKAEQLGRDMQKLGEQLPIVGPEMGSMVGEAQGSMQSAEEGLGQGDAPGAVGHQRNALEKLRQIKQELDKMGEGGGSSSSGGVPLPFGDPSSGTGEGDFGGQNRPDEKVEIPKPDAYQAPAAFREDILDAAKQGTVEQYRDAVRRYYEELVK